MPPLKLLEPRETEPEKKPNTKIIKAKNPPNVEYHATDPGGRDKR